jgi:hypothetical protein
VQVVSIEPVYWAFDQGTGVALIRGEDIPPRGALIDFMRGGALVKPGAVVPVAWQQLWDYRLGQEEVPALFRWPEFTEWIRAWPAEEAAFRAEWKQYFGLPGNDEADAAVVVWEERHAA